MKQLFAALFALAILVTPTRASAVACGDLVTHSVTLTAHLHCTSGWAALEVAASGITIDLNGYALTGVAGLTGIAVHGYHDVHIVGPGRIEGFDIGINGFDAEGLRVKEVELSDMPSGLILTRSPNGRIERNRFFRIAGTALLVNDPMTGLSAPAGHQRIVDNQFGKVDTGVRVCGALAASNRIERNAFAAMEAFGVVITDHSGFNVVAENSFHHTAGVGVQIEASKYNTLYDNRFSNNRIALAFPAVRQDACTLDPAQSHDNAWHKVQRSQITGPGGPAVMIGDALGLGLAERIALFGTVIDGADVGISFDGNTLDNSAHSSTFTGVTVPVTDYGVGNSW